MSRYQSSQKQLKEALSVIPTGSQTFSKSYYSLPEGGAPLFLKSGKGAQVTDLDGHQYIDLVNGLLSISLGYQFSEVDHAVIDQLRQGINFSLPIELETKVAKQIIAMVPSAQMVRFAKNGSDVTSAAVRLARAITGKEIIAKCGYHGWHDWYIGSTTRNKGVPGSVKQLTKAFDYNNTASLEAVLATRDVAAVIMEPMAAEYPKPGYLQAVRALCDQYQALLVFDETITGFRFSKGGAQALFDVMPDLTTLGKGMANGMPLSALAGKRQYMQAVEDIFFSGTFGGEALSLAAASAALEVIDSMDVPGYLSKQGTKLDESIQALIHHYAIDWFTTTGHPSWKIWQISGEQPLLRKAILIEQLAAQGVLTIGSHNLSYSFDDDCLNRVLSAYDQAFANIAAASDWHTLLKGKPLTPVFSVRSRD